jgi:50S ribosome-binding GTPase
MVALAGFVAGAGVAARPLARAACASRTCPSSASTAFLGASLRVALAGGGARPAGAGRRSLHAAPITMKLKSGIVGLPNVGKSTLFNALVENSAAEAANYVCLMRSAQALAFQHLHALLNF